MFYLLKFLETHRDWAAFLSALTNFSDFEILTQDASQSADSFNLWSCGHHLNTEPLFQESGFFLLDMNKNKTPLYLLPLLVIQWGRSAFCHSHFYAPDWGASGSVPASWPSARCLNQCASLRRFMDQVPLPLLPAHPQTDRSVFFTA